MEDDFNQPKLVWTPVNSDYKFTILPSNFIVNNALFMIVGDYVNLLCGFFNSYLFQYYMYLLISKGSYAYGAKEIFEQIQIPKLSENQAKELENLVQLELNGEDVEEKINSFVYSSYGLTKAEISRIQGITT